MMAGKGDLLPVSRLPGRRHLRRPAPRSGRSATSRSRSRSGTRQICIQCNKCAIVCPHAAIRAKVFDAADAAKAPATFKSTDYKGTEFKGKKYTIQVAPEDCTGCSLCVDDLPGQGQVEPEAQGDQHGADAAAARAGGRELRVLPLAPGPRPHRRQDRPEGLAVPPAAVRVLRRLLRLRRDAVRQADDAAVRRPHADRERHRLLVDLRRQPADDALHGRRQRPRPGLGELAVRGQRRVRLRHPARPRQPLGAGDSARRARQRRPRRQPRQGAPRGRPVERGRHRRAARARRCAQAGAGRREDAARSGCCRWPTTSCARTCGSSAATAGPTTSATAASTTCCRPPATSTSWSSTPRSTRTPAARPPSPRRSAPPPSSPRPARRSGRRTSA